jgi:DNA replication protein DnaC
MTERYEPLIESVRRIKMAEARIPEAYRRLSLDWYNPQTNNQRIALDAARDFVENLRDHYLTSKRPLSEYPKDNSTIGRGLLFTGPPGTGKTTLAVATLIACTERVRTYFVPASDLISMSIEQMRLTSGMDRWWEIQEALDDARQAAVLLLDDVGKEHKTSSGYAESILDELLRSRFMNARPTIVTSNLPVAKWDGYSESMGSFVKQCFSAFLMDGEDKR